LRASISFSLKWTYNKLKKDSFHQSEPLRLKKGAVAGPPEKVSSKVHRSCLLLGDGDCFPCGIGGPPVIGDREGNDVGPRCPIPVPGILWGVGRAVAKIPDP
jgi:hypothetical protein